MLKITIDFDGYKESDRSRKYRIKYKSDHCDRTGFHPGIINLTEELEIIISDEINSRRRSRQQNGNFTVEFYSENQEINKKLEVIIPQLMTQRRERPEMRIGKQDNQ